MTVVKICGITGIEYAAAAIEAGADLIGVVFASSPRQVTLEKAKEIAALAKHKAVPVVGVFVNMPAFEVNETASYCNLDMVQLSGGEAAEYCRSIEKPLIRAVHIPPQWEEADITDRLNMERRLAGNKSSVFLLDTQVQNKYGGTGRIFDWAIAGTLSKDFRLIIAGGLTPENVGRAVARLEPWGVDVSSGVETGGIKDIAKIRAFIREVRLRNKKAGKGARKEH